MNPETFHFHVGGFSCIAIRDTANRYPLGMFLTNLAKEQYEPLLRQRGENLEEIDLPYTCLVFQTERKRVLVDTGMGSNSFVPGKGKLLDHLRAEGIQPEEIDTVIISHAHPDHIGGVLAEDGKLAFPNARHVMFKEEWTYWMSNPSLAELPVDEGFKEGMKTSARKNLLAIQGQLDLLDLESQILPGLSAIHAFGHSPGQMALEISSAGDRLLFVADALILPLNLQFPEAVGVTDHLPEAMVATRLRLLAKAATEKSLVSVTHFPFPGLGHVVPKGECWEWQPISAASESRAARSG